MPSEVPVKIEDNMCKVIELPVPGWTVCWPMLGRPGWFESLPDMVVDAFDELELSRCEADVS